MPLEGVSSVSHRVRIRWMDEEVETLDDLLRARLRAVCIGINPAPRSVAAGHYYQGRLGQQFFERLRTAGLLPRTQGWEDDQAFAAAIGFTDIVKRPTTSASEIRDEEFAYGKPLLETKVRDAGPRLVIFTFKKAAEVLLGRFSGNGVIHRLYADRPVFVMPGPYAPRNEVDERLRDLSVAWQAAH